MSRLPAILKTIAKLPSRFLIGMVRLYQLFLSPIVGRQCRFEPSCSKYFIGSVEMHGAIRGSLRGLWRIVRCNPWNPGGYDPP